MKVALFGATGLTGRQVLEHALTRGHEVTVLARRPDAVGISHANLRIVKGDALDAAAVGEAVKGQQAVLQCLGVGGKGDGSRSTLVSDSTKLLITAMDEHGVRRLVCMSNMGAGDSSEFGPWIYRKFLLPVFMKWLVAIIDDKNRMEPAVFESGLDWTLGRFPAILDRPAKGTFRESFDGTKLGYSITNADCAAWLLDQLDTDRNIRKAPAVSN